MTDKATYTPAEFAALFGKERTWGYRQLYAGKVKAITKLGQTQIPHSEVEKLLNGAERYRGAPSHTKRVAKKTTGPTKFETYYDFSEPAKTIPSHRFLAIARGEAEGVLREVYLGRKGTLRPGNSNLIASKNNLAWALTESKRFAEAAALLDEHAPAGPALSPGEWRTHWRWVQNMQDWALDTAARGDKPEADRLARLALERFAAMVDRPVPVDNQERLDKVRASLAEMIKTMGLDPSPAAPAVVPSR